MYRVRQVEFPGELDNTVTARPERRGAGWRETAGRRRRARLGGC